MFTMKSIHNSDKYVLYEEYTYVTGLNMFTMKSIHNNAKYVLYGGFA